MLLEQQFFIIAKINGRYRALAGLKQRCHYGNIALKISSNIRQILQSPANRIALSHELRHATHLTKEDWRQYVDYNKISREFPFPFILTYLIIGSALEVKDNYFPAFSDLFGISRLMEATAVM